MSHISYWSIWSKLIVSFAVFMPALYLTAQAKYERDQDRHAFEVFMSNGGWCWFQDPRGIIHKKHLYLGGVQGNGSGAAIVGVYDLKQQKMLGQVTLQDQFDRDDHNAPVFYSTPSKKLMAVYARHNKDQYHYFKTAKLSKPLEWSEEQVFTHDYPNAGNVTYMNLYFLEEEGTLFNFFRGMDFNPSFIVSYDHGKTWEQPTHFIRSELEGRNRPYARYASDGKGKVHVSFTDAHPHVFGNSIYYAAFSRGQFFDAKGKLLRQHSPIKPSEAELIYQGGGKPENRPERSAENSAWTSSISVDKNGHPHIAYSVYVSNDDHRYRIASWNGDGWIDREVAFGGKCLYPKESSYTGLITLDPEDPSVVVISTDVHPSFGQDTGRKHEIYRAKIGLTDDVKTIRWVALTENSPVRNIRPVILRSKGYRVIAWMRGDFQTYQDYDLDAVGIIEKM